MSKHIIFFIASAFLVQLQVFEAFPYKVDLSATEEHTLQLLTNNDPRENSAITEGHKFLVFAYKEAQNVQHFYIRSAIDMFKKVLEDMELWGYEAKQTKSELKTYNEMSQLVERSIELRAKERELLNAYAELSNGLYEAMLNIELDPRAKNLKPVDESFQKHGLGEFDGEFSKRWTDFYNIFTVKMDNYIATLSNRKRQEEVKLIHWFQEFKTARELNRKNDIFQQFYDLFK